MKKALLLIRLNKPIVCLIFTFYSFISHAQVGIGTTTPNAALDVVSSTNGFLLPRVALTSTDIQAPVVNPQGGNLPAGTMVWNTNTAGTIPTNVGPGLYYWDGLRWVAFAGSPGGLDWSLTGNTGTDPASNFVGTIDNKELNFRINNNPSGKLSLTSTSFGYRSLINNTGSGNSSFGLYALYNNTSGINNTAFGTLAGYYNTTGQGNAFFGSYALYKNTTGRYNTAIGSFSAYAMTTGQNNVAIGRNSLFKTTTGWQNVSIGPSSLDSNIDGHNNMAIGYYSLAPVTGYANVGIGSFCMDGLTSGISNTAIGDHAYVGSNYSQSTAIGTYTPITASYQIRLGSSGVSSIGGFAGWTNVSDKRFKKNINYSNVPGLDFILKLKPVTYNLDLNSIDKFVYKDYLKKKRNINEEYIEADLVKNEEKEKELQTGFIAQEVENAAKEIGFDFSGVDKPKNENDYYGLRYAEFVVPLVKAVQEQNEKIIELQNKIIELEKKISNRQ